MSERPTEYLYQFVIYENPTDYPDRFVVRKWRIGGGAVEAAVWPTKVVDSLEEARSHVPDGLVNIGRTSGDDPVIREVWT